MNNRRLSYGLLLTLATAAVACGDPQVEPVTPPAPTASAEVAPAPPPEPAPAPAPEPPAPAPAPAPPPPTPGSKKFIGTWVQSYEGALQTATEAAALKVSGKAGTASPKYAAAVKKAQDAAAKVQFVNTADTHTYSVNGKVVHTITYAVGKDDPTNFSIKLMKDGKKDMKGIEVPFTFVDDNTVSVTDPFAKKGPMLLVFKRQ